MPASLCSADKRSVWHNFPVAYVLPFTLVSPSTDICFCLSRTTITRSIRSNERSYEIVSRKIENSASNGYRKG